MKKIIYIIAAVVEVLLLAGSFAVDYFTRKKMGMARYVSYKSFLWEEQYRIEVLVYVAAAVLLLLLAALLIFVLLKKRKISKWTRLMMIVSAVLVLWYGWFVLTGSREAQRSYYFVSILYGAAAFVQVLKSYITVLVSGNEE